MEGNARYLITQQEAQEVFVDGNHHSGSGAMDVCFSRVCIMTILSRGWLYRTAKCCFEAMVECL